MGVKYIYADAWSAPGYMKTNGNYVCRRAKIQARELLTEKWGFFRKMVVTYVV